MAEMIAKTKVGNVPFLAENSIQSRTVVNGLMICATKKSICKFRDIRKTAGSRRGPTCSGTVSIGTTTAADTRVIRNGANKKFIFFYEKVIGNHTATKKSPGNKYYYTLWRKVTDHYFHTNAIRKHPTTKTVPIAMKTKNPFGLCR